MVRAQRSEGSTGRVYPVIAVIYLYNEEMTITPVHDKRGEITHFVAIKQDITRRKAVQLRP